MKKWYYAINGSQQGPVTEDELRRIESTGAINSLTLVWCAEMSNWTALGSVPANLLPPVASAAQIPVMTYAPQPSAQETHPFEFHGKGGEFFRIWIVNVVLTVLTLGIYAAWAKVRTLRYFYGNTVLNGKPFDFTGNPISILKGNLIFGGIFIIYVITGAIFPPLSIAVILLIGVLSPWLIQKALRFRAHNTVHRNVRFNFRGAVSESYTVYMWMNILIPFTLGLIMPYIQFRQKKFFLGNMGWGNCQANMNGKAGFFYKAFFKSFGALILLVLLAGIAVPIFTAMQNRAKKEVSAPFVSQFEKTAPVLAQTDSEARLDQAPEDAAGVNPDLTEEEREKMRESVHKARERGEMMVLFIILPFYFLFFLAFIYYNTSITNYSMNVTQWGELGHLESKVRVRDMLWLYFSNGLTVLFSLGLLIPWVQVRMARYRASKTSFIAAGSLDSVAQSIGTGDSAIGDAGADIFDFDIGF